MKKVFVIFFVVILLAGIVVGAEETHNVIIKYKEQPQSKSMRLFSTQSVPEIAKEKIRHDFGNTKSATLTISEINNLKNNPNVEIFDIPTRNILMTDSIYLTNSTDVWSKQINSINLTGLGETICIIDTGVYYNHTDFGNCYGNNSLSSDCKIIGGWDYCADDTNCATEDWDPMDINGHGTHVTGIVAANGTMKGIAPDAKIVMIKAANSTGTLWDDDIKAGIQFCINNADAFNISTISMSLGGGKYSTYCDGVNDPAGITQAINDAVAKNITVTVATGNNDYTDGISSPACIENATRVGSVTKTSLISNFTNRGSFFSDIILTIGGTDGGGVSCDGITSPSNKVCSTYKNGGYAAFSGTSMATPMAAGIITLLRQYKKLESNINLTTNYIEEVLINSSTLYEDAPSSGNYSIINSLAAILYSDTQAPNITSMLPINSSKLSQNQSFSCNVTDLQLSNLTIKIYNSTSDLVKNQTTINNSLTLYYDTTNDEYNWTCEAIDNNSNSIIKTNTLSVSSLFVSINSTNNTYTKNNNTNFNCSSTTSKELSNITFSIYNSTDLLNSSKINLTGTSNYSIFNYNLTNEGEYYYNCLIINNESQNVSTGNYTITYDITSPQINLTTPANNTTSSSPITFTYNETETNKDSCNLTINNITKSSFTQNLANANYNWSVTCTDLANNTNTSETRLLTIYTAPVPAPTQSSGGGGGGSSTPTEPNTYTATETQLENGYNKKLKVKEIINFPVKSSSHKLTLNKINTDKIEITVESTPINVTLYINSAQKINLDNDETFDLEITLLSIINNYADIKIKEINETVPVKHIFVTKPIINETNQTEENKTDIKEPKKTPDKNNYVFIFVILFLLIIIWIKTKIIDRNKNKNKKNDIKNDKLLKIKHKF